ncbi:MAG: DoxX family protein [Chitinophagaceae bacterium]|jgi:uncharacterized membrane protein YphA (DoxX/SURF4 family)|nr:DoxX family protein [Chitinophagaceae bacterium]
MKITNILLLAVRLAIVALLYSTLWFKFTGHPESVALFTKLGVEPYGRLFTGVVELITGLLLLIRRTAWAGALMGLGTMGGAILSHFFIIGIESAADGGQLFFTACIIAFLCGIILWAYRKEIKFLRNNR